MKSLARAIPPLLLAALLAPAAASAAGEPGAGGLAIGQVGPAVESGGYPTTYWGYNGLALTFSDATPGADGHVYTATATPAGGGEPLTGTWTSYDGWDGQGAYVRIGTREDFPLDTAWTVTLTEQDGESVLETSAPVDFLLEAVGHPSWAELGVKKAEGKDGTVKAGSKVKVKWTGDWEQGTKLTQVVYAVDRKGHFEDKDVLVCEGSWCPTKKGERWVKYGTEKLTAFSVPKRLAGKTLRIVVYGNRIKGGMHLKAQWGWEWQLKVRKVRTRTAPQQVVTAPGIGGSASAG